MINFNISNSPVLTTARFPGDTEIGLEAVDAEEDMGDDEATPHEVGHNIYILAYQASS